MLCSTVGQRPFEVVGVLEPSTQDGKNKLSHMMMTRQVYIHIGATYIEHMTYTCYVTDTYVMCVHVKD